MKNTGKAKTALAAPQGLSREARARWAELVHEQDLDDAAGRQILATALEAFDRMRGAQRRIRLDGIVTKDRFGQLRAHPLLAVERDARAAWLAALKALNFDLEPLHDGPGRPGGR